MAKRVCNNAGMPAVPHVAIPGDLAAAAHSLGMSTVVVACLWCVAQHPRATAAQIAEETRLTPPTVRRTMTRLVATGMVTRNSIETAGRGHRYHYTLNVAAITAQLDNIREALGSESQ